MNLLLEEDRIKIPLKLRKLINDERLKDYNPQYSFEKPIDEQEISDEALAMIALLHINYWCNVTKKRKNKQYFKRIMKTNIRLNYVKNIILIIYLKNKSQKY